MERQAKDGTFYKQVGPDEWAPVTRAAKDGTIYQKVGQDAWEPLRAPAQSQENDGLKDVAVAAERGVLFGARPFVAGVGGAVGKTIGRLERDTNESFTDKLKGAAGAFTSGFKEARGEAQTEEADLQTRRPGLVMAGDIGGAVMTAPLMAAKGLQAGGGLLKGAGQAAKIGAITGGSQALGHADSVGEGLQMIGTGALTGAAVQTGFNAASKVAPAVWSGIKSGAKKVASGLTGVSEKEISTYATRADEVKKMISESGGNISDAADTVRESISRDVQVARQKLGGQIGAALKSEKYANTAVDARPMLQKIDDVISSVGDVTARFRPDEINELKNLRDLVAGSIDDAGRVGLNTLNDIKEELQAIAKPSYNNGSRIFPKGDLAAKASKGAAAEARRLLNEAAPEIKAANDQLRRLHIIEEGINKNLIRAGRSESALLAAGSGSNPRNLKYLQSVDEITGGNAVHQAENLAAARSFNDTQLLPVDSTGKAVARMMTGGGVGTIVGGPVGGIIGTAATSPAALKYGIEAGRAISRAGQVVGKGASSVIPQAPSGTGRAAASAASVRRSPLRTVVKSNGDVASNSSEIDRESDGSYKDGPYPRVETPIRGIPKWTNDGFNKIQASVDPEFGAVIEAKKDELMRSSRAKRLFLAASDLKPGSKAMQSVIAKLKTELE
jgi:hypothetical protein